MQKIDLAVWPRAELFRFFSTVSDPFYSVTFRVDVTNLHAYTKAHGISFYYALCYLATDAGEFPLHHPGRRGFSVGRAHPQLHRPETR